MNKKRNIGISIAASLMSAALVYGLFQLQQLQLEKEETIAVVVPKRFIEAGKRLEASDLTYRRMPREAVDGSMLLQLNQAEGMETIVPLGTNEPILVWKINRFRLLPASSESTFQIPREYIRSISNGIRAGDKVSIYVSGEGQPSGRLFEKLVTVASVKSSGNVEIDDAQDPNLLSLADGDLERMYASRRDANGMIDYINLNLSEEQWLQIDSYCKDGVRKLVIAFSPESLSVASEGAAP
ncbi:SAF domain-containing protein [Paenibacillus sp. NEAU-GSW1]|uniref:SAF domain-containing protein n=1 Tax=Paenibacillus sp. NEAU-GSW1 TaxID=2682486 RepID=UPI0012E2B156|nr:SAF domain-containing protein [Paenibacillus sp. NEAU-GSW1]MUT68639.1 flagellar biosynthesis protein FlgA [Paenibacillus sp. NEAU-GSW1]